MQKFDYLLNVTYRNIFSLQKAVVTNYVICTSSLLEANTSLHLVCQKNHDKILSMAAQNDARAASTCDLSITLPVHYHKDYSLFKESINSALVEGIGFGLL